MKRWMSAAMMAAALATGPAYAQDQVSPDGVKVDKMSPLRKLVPEGALENAASQQYSQLQDAARQQGALVPADDARVKRLQSIAQKLIPHAERWNPAARDWKWEVALFESPQINAFCMPGGKIGFFSGILKDLKLTDDEVAIVMGHEMAHALREHSRERMAKSGLTSFAAGAIGSLLSSMAGVDPRITDFAANVGTNLAIMKFSRSDETESDLVGLDIAARAGFDPRAGEALWKKMGIVNDREPIQWLSTHPAGTARIAQMQKHMPSVLPLYAKAKGKPVSALPPYVTNVKEIGPVK